MIEPDKENQVQPSTGVDPVKDVKDSPDTNIEKIIDLLKKKNGVYESDVEDLVNQGINCAKYREECEILVDSLDEFDITNEETKDKIYDLMDKVMSYCTWSNRYFSGLIPLATHYTRIYSLKQKLLEDLTKHLDNIPNFIKSEDEKSQSIDIFNSIKEKNTEDKDLQDTIDVVIERINSFKLGEKSDTDNVKDSHEREQDLPNNKHGIVLSDDEYDKLPDDIKKLPEKLKELNDESERKSEKIVINGGIDTVFWRSEYTDNISLNPGNKTLFGMPYLQHKTKDGHKFQNITLSNFDDQKYPDGIRPEIKRVKTSTGDTVFLFENQRFTMEEMINHFKPDSVKNRELFRYALQCLKVEEQTIYEPYIIEKDNHLYFPDIKNIYSDPKNEIQSFYVNSLKIGDVNQDFIKQGRDLLSKYPKQLEIYLIIPAQVVVNLLGVEDFLYTLEVISGRDTGKSFSIKVTMHHFEGITEVYKGDVLNSNFRINKISSGTNLSFYVEEAEISSKIRRMMKTTGKTGRGKPDQSIPFYESKFSLILSENSREEDTNQYEQEAQDKRFLQIYLNDKDVIHEHERGLGKRYLNRMKKENGGLLFTEILKKFTIDELKDKYFELDEKYSNILELLLHYGEYLTGINYEYDIDFGEKEEDNWLKIFYEWALSLSDYYKQRDIRKNLAINRDSSTNTTVIEIVFDDEIFQLFKSDHRDLPFSRISDFRKKYKEFLKTGSFSIGGFSTYRTKLTCNDYFYRFIGTIPSKKDQDLDSFMKTLK